MESMDYRQKIIANGEKSRETMKKAYEEGNKRLEEEKNKPNQTASPETPAEDNKETEPENNFVKRQREIREELKDKSLWPKTNE
jgi:hypothetical protein